MLLYDNYACVEGGGIYLDQGDVDIACSNTWDNFPDDYSGLDDPTGADGNLAVDPELLGSNFHLAIGSPLIDAGDPSVLDPDGSPSDLGAFGGPGADDWDLDGDGYPGWWLPCEYDAATSPGLDCDDLSATVFPGSGC